jgi:hypothetical protein
LIGILNSPQSPTDVCTMALLATSNLCALPINCIMFVKADVRSCYLIHTHIHVHFIILMCFLVVNSRLQVGSALAACALRFIDSEAIQEHACQLYWRLCECGREQDANAIKSHLTSTGAARVVSQAMSAFPSSFTIHAAVRHSHSKFLHHFL